MLEALVRSERTCGAASTPDEEKIRSPILDLPTFVTPKFLRRFVPLTNRDIRTIHEEYGRALEAMTGANWPHERPSVDEFYEFLTGALVHPAFALTFGAYIPWEAKSKGRGPLPASDKRVIATAIRDSGRELRSGANEYAITHPYLVRVFIEIGGDIDTALGMYFTAGLRCAQIANEPLENLLADFRAAADAAFDSRFKEAYDYFFGAMACLRWFGDGSKETPFDLVGSFIEAQNEKMVKEVPAPASEDNKSNADGPTDAASEDGVDAVDTNSLASATRLKSPSASVPSYALEDVLDPTANMEAPLEGDDIRPALSNTEEACGHWMAETQLLRALAEEAAAAGPNESTIARLREALTTLTWLNEQAEALASKTAVTATLVGNLRALITSIDASLSELVGDDEEVAQIKTTLDAIPKEVPAEALGAAEKERREAETVFALARDLARQIEQNEEIHPRKKAHDLNQPLLFEEEGQLRASLKHICVSIETLKPVPQVVGSEPTSAASHSPSPEREPAPVASPATAEASADAADMDEANLIDDYTDVFDDEDEGLGTGMEHVVHIEEAADVPPPAPQQPIQPQEAGASDPLREHVI